jgi:two-component system chemotaxis response regulator CheY
VAEGDRRALVVDDTSIMRTIVGRIMREAQFDVTEATNGAEAIQSYFRERPDIVIMDLTMDGIDGASAIRGILQIDPQARVIVCSSTSDAHVVLNLLKIGARGYITKPFTPEKLLKTVDAALTA